MDARARRDKRIKQRRAREDIAFQRFREEFDKEETVSSRAEFQGLADVHQAPAQTIEEPEAGPAHRRHCPY